MSGNDIQHFTLLQLNTSIQNHIARIGRSIWTTAEVSSAQIRNGHAYIELVQKEEERIVAKARAIIWSRQLEQLEDKLGTDVLSVLLNQGTKVLLLVTVNFHPVHGLSLVIADIDPSYTIGELEIRRRETLRRLEENELIDKQGELILPVVVQKVAVLSSEQAAGFADFCNQLFHNPYGYQFFMDIYPVNVQGEKAVKDIVKQLGRLEKKKYDAVIIIRGGGSKLDLQAFDEYEIAEKIANSRHPVLTGIGHQIDESVADIVAHTPLKTPTAVADFLINRMLHFEMQLEQYNQQIRQLAAQSIVLKKEQLNRISHQISLRAKDIIAQQQSQLEQIGLSLKLQSKYFFEKQHQQLDNIQKQIEQLNPLELLKKGYSITLKDGKPLVEGEEVNEGDKITTITAHQELESTVTSANSKV